MNDIKRQAKALNERIVCWRRYLHTIPETGFETVRTSAFVSEQLEHIGVSEMRRGVAQNGITAMIYGELPGKVLGLRADMDALPVEERTNLPFSSRNNFMHACGHDGHTAMLLGAAELIAANRSHLKGAVKLIFQSAEEIDEGAAAMIRDGALENPHVEAIAGLHTGSLWAGFSSGEIGVRFGPMMAAADGFEIVLHGKGGHGGAPHRAIDPIAIGCEIHSALRTMTEREFGPSVPVVASVCAFQGGEAHNVIPSLCTLRGTLRALTPEVRSRLKARVKEIAENTAQERGGTACVEFLPGPPAVINDRELTRKLKSAATTIVGPERVRELEKPIMASEDMACYMEVVPGTFFFHPSTYGDDRDYPHHHPAFSINEDVLWIGSAVMAQFALTWQED